jgi:hypothetical protein
MNAHTGGFKKHFKRGAFFLRLLLLFFSPALPPAEP